MSDILDNAQKDSGGGIVLTPPDSAGTGATPPPTDPAAPSAAPPPQLIPTDVTSMPQDFHTESAPGTGTPSEPAPDPAADEKLDSAPLPPKPAANPDSLIVPPPPSETVPSKTGLPKKPAAIVDNTIPPDGTKKKKSKLGAILAVLLFLLFVVPIGVYYVSQRGLLIYGPSRANQPPGPYPGVTTRQECKDAGGDEVTEPGGECGCGGYRVECVINGQHYKMFCETNPNANCGNDTPTPTSHITNTPTVTRTGTPSTTITGTVTSTPVSPQCTNIKVFKDGVRLDQAGLNGLKPGDAVVITVAGGNATKGHIRVNGGNWSESATTNASGAYTFNYTIPSDITSFTIESEIFGTDGHWH